VSHDEPDVAREPTPEERRAAEAVRALAEPRAPEPFRADLRARFVSGAIAADAAAAAPASAPSVAAPRGRPAPVVALFGLAAAAALAWLVWTGTEPDPWHYMGASGDSGEVWVSGRRMDPGDADGIQSMLRGGVPLRTTGTMQLDYAMHDQLSVQLAPESEMTVPEWPRRWMGDVASCQVARGEARFTTGPRYGSRLQVSSPLAMIEVTGTTLAVISGADSSCVCVLDGEVLMTDPDGTTHAVQAGTRRTVYRSAPSRVDDILPMERMKLEMHRDLSAGH
jgi:ferric-dicitrate binding protein FerR (iron transport regulator)